MYSVFLIFLALFQIDKYAALPDANQVRVIDGGKFRPYALTQFDAGPSTGNMLNNHFFPSVIAYNQGRYNYAVGDFTYVITRSEYLNGNSRKAEFMSIALYLRGMIYLYHSEGVGRHVLARNDFQAAVNWNPANHMAYLELARTYSDLGFTKEAIQVIQHLLQLKPPMGVAEEAQQELNKLGSAVAQ